MTETNAQIEIANVEFTWLATTELGVAQGVFGWTYMNMRGVKKSETLLYLRLYN